MPHTLAELNRLSRDQFVQLVGPAFEHSPWIAEATWPERPFRSVEELHRALCRKLNEAGSERQLALIRAHPDLVGRLVLEGKVTKESRREQSCAGLDRLTPDEIALFQKQNASYKAKFGFPFIICARLNNKAAILNAITMRMQHSADAEITAALQEIFKIAELRLRDLTHA